MKIKWLNLENKVIKSWKQSVSQIEWKRDELKKLKENILKL